MNRKFPNKNSFSPTFRNLIFVGLGSLLLLNGFFLPQLPSDMNLIFIGMGTVMVFLGSMFLVKREIQRRLDSHKSSN